MLDYPVMKHLGWFSWLLVIIALAATRRVTAIPMSILAAIAEDMMVVLRLIKDGHRGDLGFEPEVQAIWRLWRGARKP
jgi:hypothetical protein